MLFLHLHFTSERKLFISIGYLNLNTGIFLQISHFCLIWYNHKPELILLSLFFVLFVVVVLFIYAEAQKLRVQYKVANSRSTVIYSLIPHKSKSIWPNIYRTATTCLPQSSMSCPVSFTMLCLYFSIHLGWNLTFRSTNPISHFFEQSLLTFLSHVFLLSSSPFLDYYDSLRMGLAVVISVQQMLALIVLIINH